MSESSLSSFNSCLILVVEDNEDLRMLYAQALEAEGYQVILASNGKEALELLQRPKNAPQFILLDLMMPVMDGWEFLKEREKKDFLRSIPVVVCSASKEAIPSDVQFLKKPVELDSLLGVAARYRSR